MRRVLLDECMDWRLGRELAPHHIVSVSKMGWSGLKNGTLLRQAQDRFEVFVTMDRNLSFQQRVVAVDIGVIVVAAKSNRLQDLLPAVPRLLKAIATVIPGEVLVVHAEA